MLPEKPHKMNPLSNSEPEPTGSGNFQTLTNHHAISKVYNPPQAARTSWSVTLLTVIHLVPSSELGTAVLDQR